MAKMSCTLVINQDKGTIKSDDVTVIYLNGSDAVSSFYRFEMKVAISKNNKNSQWQHVKQILNSPARLSIETDIKDSKNTVAWNGLVTSIVQDGEDDAGDKSEEGDKNLGHYYYTFVLEPMQAKLRWLVYSDVYIDKCLDQVICDVMTESGFGYYQKLAKESLQDSDMYDFVIDSDKKDSFSRVLKNTHQNFTCQFEESCLDFIKRRLEFYGVYFTFKQINNKSCVVFSHDLRVPGKDSADYIKARYLPKYNTMALFDVVAVTHLSKKLCVQANELYLQRSSTAFNTDDANLTSASQQLSAHEADTEMATYSTKNQFEVLDNNDENNNRHIENRRVSGQYLAEIRSGAVAAKQLEVTGIAITPGIVAGSFIDIDGVSGSGENDNKYFVLSVKHEFGSPDETFWTQHGAVEQRYKADLVLHPCFDDEDKLIPYYPPQTVKTPCIERMLSGFIDSKQQSSKQKQDTPTATTDITYPYIDQYGRYRVRFSFTKTLQKSSEQNSSWLRLASNYAGGVRQQNFDQNGDVLNNPDTNYDNSGGMHFPLRPGTEVLIAFVNGDPDYPFIVSALANERSPSPVTTKNINQFVLQTPIGNRMVINDMAKVKKDDVYENSPYSSWNFGTPAMDSQFKLGGYSFTGVDNELYSSSGFVLSTKGMGIVQSEGMLYIKSKQGVQISSGDQDPENTFSTFIKVASQVDTSQSPSFSDGSTNPPAVNGGVKDEEEHEGEEHDEHRHPTEEDVEFIEEAIGEINDKKHDSVHVSHKTETLTKAVGAEGTAEAVGLEGGVKAVGFGFDGKAAIADIEMFAGGLKVDAVLAALIAEAEFSLGKVGFEFNAVAKEYDWTHEHRMELNEKDVIRAEVTKDLKIKIDENVVKKAEMYGKHDVIINDVNKLITTSNETYGELTRTIGVSFKDDYTLGAELTYGKKYEIKPGKTNLTGKSSLEMTAEILKLQNDISKLEMKTEKLELKSKDVIISATKEINLNSVAVTALKANTKLVLTGTALIQLN